MNRTISLKLLTVATALTLAGGIAQAKTPGDDLVAQVRKRLSELKSPRPTELREVTDASVVRVFPKTPLVTVIYRQFPVGVALPEPIRANNLFFAEEKNALGQITEAKELQTFFLKNTGPAKAESSQKEALLAWLLLSTELKKDGFFVFITSETSIKVVTNADKSITATGISAVKPLHGDTGEIKATLKFDAMGKLLSAGETSTVKSGVRPICQATKLLDRDPIVRKMAERDLLVMGKDARSYLDYIRPQLTPALRKAADRVWNQIVAESRY